MPGGLPVQLKKIGKIRLNESREEASSIPVEQNMEDVGSDTNKESFPEQSSKGSKRVGAKCGYEPNWEPQG